jgi:hypothetical protein
MSYFYYIPGYLGYRLEGPSNGAFGIFPLVRFKKYSLLIF